MKTLNPKNQYTAVIKQDGDWWLGWIAEVPGVNCQEKDLESLRASLRSGLGEMLDLNCEDALKDAGDDFQTEKVMPPEEVIWPDEAAVAAVG